MRQRKPLRSSTELISFLNQAAHLRARQTGRDADDIEPLERGIDDFGAAAEGPPRLLLAAAQSEWNAGAEAQRRVLGDIEIGRRVRAIDRAAADGVERLTAGRELAGLVGLDEELVVGRLGDVAAQDLRGAEHRLHGLGKAGGQAPLDLGRGLGDCRGRERWSGERGRSARPQEFSASHEFLLPPFSQVVYRTSMQHETRNFP